MNPKKPVVIFALLFIVCNSWSAVSAFGQEKESLTDEVYLAKDDGKGKPGEATETFTVSDGTIFCVVILKTGGPAAIKMQLVPVDAAGTKAKKPIVVASYDLKEGQDRVYFTGKPYQTWMAGKYRAEVYVNGKLDTARDFSIVNAPGPVPAGFVEPKTRPSGVPRKN